MPTKPGLYLGVRNEQDSYPQGLTVHGGAKQKINKQIYKTSIYYYLLGGQLSTNSDFYSGPYEVVLCINTKGNSERQKNPAAREFTPSSFLFRFLALPVPSTWVRVPQNFPGLAHSSPRSQPEDTSSERLPDRALPWAPSHHSLLLSVQQTYSCFTYHYLIFLLLRKFQRASRGLNRFVLLLN